MRHEQVNSELVLFKLKELAEPANRISVDYTPDFLVSHINGQILSMNNEEAKRLCDSTKTINIGSIADISEMVTVDELLNSYFREEVE